MFDLIGFWSIVTALTVLLASPLVLIGILVILHLGYKAIDASNPKYKYGEYDKWRCFIRKLPIIRFYYDGSEPSTFAIFSILSGFVLWCVCAIAMYAPGIVQGYTLVQLIALWGTNLSPVGSFVGILASGYIGLLFIVKKSYVWYLKINKVIGKLDESNK